MFAILHCRHIYMDTVHQQHRKKKQLDKKYPIKGHSWQQQQHQNCHSSSQFSSLQFFSTNHHHHHHHQIAVISHQSLHVIVACFKGTESRSQVAVKWCQTLNAP
ncbi:hypothetical protein CFOL_v3_32033 [Cephalotus follicularis]|uniref:Uncharacterized protein n=1 Tax=Cephalotus follicularis TaxID=3775 RepID=A0A1Q3D853_CEPFO|nr:hypothetical protein CFOL_v3_32033 [Cephalotus follicularis]